MFLFILGIIGGLLYYILMLPVKNIYVLNNHIVKDDEIIKLAKLDSYPSFLLTKKSLIKDGIEKNSYVESVNVYKKFGNIIYLDIKEYEPVVLNKEGKLILSNGMLIDNIYELSDIPVLINEIENKDIFIYFAKRFGVIDRDILRQISEIEYSPLPVDEERFLLYMNDGNSVYVTLTKIYMINRYNDIRDKLGTTKGTIYLDAGNYMEVRG